MNLRYFLDRLLAVVFTITWIGPLPSVYGAERRAGPVACEFRLERGSPCALDISDLRPTQFAVGLREVREKQKDYAKLSRRERAEYLSRHPIPVIIGKGGFYAIDHHHLARAVWEVGDSQLVATIHDNWNGLSGDEFWRKMAATHNVYLFDENGRGPLSPTLLPTEIGQLADDPYRSLSAKARDQGCYQKTPVPFAEFRWAEFFRARLTNLTSTTPERDFIRTVKSALRLCHLSEARLLPGWTP